MRLPQWLESAMQQAEASSKDGCFPLVALHQDGTRYADSLVLMRLRDYPGGVPPTLKPEHGNESTSNSVVELFTDGGCLENPGTSAWAAVIYDGPKPQEISGFERDTTNNRQELRAAIEALKALKGPRRVRLHSDSAYLVSAFAKGWVYNWERNGWRKADKKPVQNVDLWRELLGLTRFHDVEFVKVAGHAGIPGNERANSHVQTALCRDEPLQAVRRF